MRVTSGTYREWSPGTAAGRSSGETHLIASAAPLVGPVGGGRRGDGWTDQDEALAPAGGRTDELGILITTTSQNPTAPPANEAKKTYNDITEGRVYIKYFFFWRNLKFLSFLPLI